MIQYLQEVLAIRNRNNDREFIGDLNLVTYISFPHLQNGLRQDLMRKKWNPRKITPR